MKAKKANLAEEEALRALKTTFQDRYVIPHPHIVNCVPDAMTLTFDYFQISGFEIKTTRQDWLVELRGKKNEAARQASNYWSMIGDEKVIHLSDLPSGWGLYRVIEGRLICEVEPSQQNPSRILDRDFVSKLLRCVVNDIPITDQIREVRDQAYADAFEAILGNQIFRKMGVKKLVAFAKIFEDRSHVRAVNGLTAIRNELTHLLDRVNGHLSSLPEEKDWESGGDFPPDVLKFGEQIKTELLTDPAHGHFYRANPDILNQVIQGRMWTFIGH